MIKKIIAILIFISIQNIQGTNKELLIYQNKNKSKSLITVVHKIQNLSNKIYLQLNSKKVEINISTLKKSIKAIEVNLELISDISQQRILRARKKNNGVLKRLYKRQQEIVMV